MISVIMLTYNREALISRAIESILAQTFRDFEFIIVDNGSIDRSGQIAEEYAARDGRIRVIHRDRGNIGMGRNTGLNAAQGEYIAFIDDDDWVEPDFLEFLLGLITETCADIAICGASDKACDEKQIMTAEEALIELMWRKKYNAGFPTKLIHVELFKYLCFQPPNLTISASCISFLRKRERWPTMDCLSIISTGTQEITPAGLRITGK